MSSCTPSRMSIRRPTHRLFIKRAALAILSLAATAVPLQAAVINVPGDAPTIQVAINLSASGDEIVVAPGTYFEALNLNGKTLTIRSTAGPQTTIIDAVGQFTPVIRIINGEGAATLIEGFTLRNGQATGAPPTERGGGLFCNLTSPTIRNCVFTGNLATIGGAFYANGGSPVLENCSFIDNSTQVASGSGGAAYLNASSTSFADCLFESNTAAGPQGGAIIMVNGAYTYTRCSFIDNESTTFGGAFSVINGGQVTVNDGWFEANFSGDGGANGRGGAIYAGAAGTAVTVTNSVFFNNSVSVFGGAIYAGAAVTARNCTFHGNTAESGQNGVVGSSSATLRNCVAWNNGSTPVASPSNVAYSNVEGGFAGAGNIGGDSADNPLFVDAASGDLRIQDGSPCIDAGAVVYLPSEVGEDFDGQPRVVNGLASGATGLPAYGYFIDMGAYEFQPEGGPPSSCPADLNGDDVINVLDLLQVLSAWGVCP